jgi:hypothetical protein
MISPELWESESFGALDLLGKILYIGMISQADDEGRGILSPQLLKSKILPYDVVRNADVEKALSDIGQNTSTVFYEVNGKHYYYLENWTKWQYIQKPIPSKFPCPPICGEGETIRNTEVVTEKYDSSTVVVTEGYQPIEKKGKEKKGIEERDARARHTPEILSFLERNPRILWDANPPKGFDFVLLEKKIKESSFLGAQTLLSFFIKHYDKILADGYKDFHKPNEGVTKGNSFGQRSYREEELNELLNNLGDLK